jgi:hypothetical protein
LRSSLAFPRVNRNVSCEFPTDRQCTLKRGGVATLEASKTWSSGSTGSRRARQESSPRRKPWVNSGPRASPEGAKDRVMKQSLGPSMQCAPALVRWAIAQDQRSTKGFRNLLRDPWCPSWFMRFLWIVPGCAASAPAPGCAPEPTIHPQLSQERPSPRRR